MYRYTLASLLEKWSMQIHELHLEAFYPTSKIDLLKNKDISLFIIQNEHKA